MIKYLLLVFLCISATMLRAQSVTFQITTTAYKGQFSPRNAGVIWVEDSTNKFVKTLQLWANGYKQALIKWKAATNSTYNVVDATTSASLTTHKAHTATWNCTNTSKKTVANGTYYIKCEYTEDNSHLAGKPAGKLYTISFQFDNSSDTQSPANDTYFTNIKLSYTAPVNEVEEIKNVSDIFNEPNPFIDFTEIHYSLSKPERVNIKIFNEIGNLIKELDNGLMPEGEQILLLNSEDLPPGVYFYTIQTDSFLKSNKMVIQK